MIPQVYTSPSLSLSPSAESLGEFGKHIPQAKPMQMATSDPSSSSSSSLGSGPTPSAGTDAFDDIFSEEFAAEAEAQLNEAMEMLASENPELWQQFESFAKSMGMGGPGGTGGGGGASQSQATPTTTTTSGAASGGGRGTSVDEDGGGGKPRGGPANLDDQLEETLKRLRETTEQIEVSSYYIMRRSVFSAPLIKYCSVHTYSAHCVHVQAR